MTDPVNLSHYKREFLKSCQLVFCRKLSSVVLFCFCSFVLFCFVLVWFVLVCFGLFVCLFVCFFIQQIAREILTEISVRKSAANVKKDNRVIL